MEKILKSFLKRLANISSNNRSVCLLKLYSEQFFDLNKLDFLYKQPSFYLISALIAGKKKIFVAEEWDSRDESVNEVSKVLKKIARREKLLFEESGASNLYVGWPFVKGKFSDGSIVRCPLLFFPVALVVENAKWHLVQRDAMSVMLNKNFVLAYAHFNNNSIADEWLESSFEDFNKDATLFRTALYEFIKNSPLELNFNQDLFVDKLIDFKEYNAAEYDSLNENGVLKLHSEAVLGIFPQAGSYLVPDYEALINNNEFPDLEKFLESKINAAENLKNREEDNYVAFQIDASQEEALLRVKEGKSLVVQGPPGTGKSQLICNLISDFTARGKKVLLVCQKKAALDVVYERLKQKEVHIFAALVHDIRNDRAKIAEQLCAQIGAVEGNKKLNSGLDSIYLERMFTQSSRQIRYSQEMLDSFRQALFSTADFGISVKELYLSSSPYTFKIPLNELAFRFTLETSINFERKIKNFMHYAFLFMKEDYCWKDRVSFDAYYQRDQQVIIDTVLEIAPYQKKLQESAARQLKNGIENYTVSFFIENAATATEIDELIKDEDDYFFLLTILDEKIDAFWMKERKRKILNCFSKGTPESTLLVEHIAACELKISNYLEARKNVFREFYWKLFSQDRAYLEDILHKNGLKLSREGVKALLKKIIRKKKFEKESAVLLKKKWAKSFPKKSNLADIEAWFENYFCVQSVKELILNSKEMRLLVDYSKNEYKVFSDNFKLIELLSNDAKEHYKKWRRYLTPAMIALVMEKKLNVIYYSMYCVVILTAS